MVPGGNPFSEQSSDYRQYRPGYPAELFDCLARLVSKRDLAWDCATGNGQAAQQLGRLFTRVFATDISLEQLQQAPRCGNIDYAVSPAEQVGLPDNSVDLIMVAQALHWFDLDRFFAESRRVLKAEGLLAAVSYDFLSVDPQVDRIIGQLYYQTLGEYWPVERKLVEARYRTIDFPFTGLQLPEFAMIKNWSLPDLFGYLSTWSAVKQYTRVNGSNPLDLYRSKLEQAWGDDTGSKKVRWPLTVIAGRF